jgi:hypothetical protein
MSVVITLVHGTWAERSEWTQEGSAFRSAFENALKDKVSFRVFPWTGRNSFGAREQASGELRAFLQEGFALHPKALHSIIAHSHGGNIALKALEDQRIRPRIATLTCLSTPFLTVAERNFGPSVVFNKLAFQIGLGAAAAALIDWRIPFLHRFAAKALATNANSLTNFGFVLLFALEIVLVWALLEVVLNVWRGYARRALEMQTIQPVSGLRLLVIRPPADEASNALAATQFVAWLSTGLWQLSARVQTWLREAIDKWSQWSNRHKVWSYLLAVAILMLSLWLTGDDTLRKARPRWLLGPILVGVTALVIRSLYVRAIIYLALAIWTLIVGLLFLPVLAILCIAVLPFSPWDALLMGPLQIAAEAAPIGRCEIMQLPPSIRSKGLMHSATYEHRLAVQACVAWVLLGRPLGQPDPLGPLPL